MEAQTDDVHEVQSSLCVLNYCHGPPKYFFLLSLWMKMSFSIVFHQNLKWKLNLSFFHALYMKDGGAEAPANSVWGTPCWLQWMERCIPCWLPFVQQPVVEERTENRRVAETREGADLADTICNFLSMYQPAGLLPAGTVSPLTWLSVKIREREKQRDENCVSSLLSL